MSITSYLKKGAEEIIFEAKKELLSYGEYLAEYISRVFDIKLSKEEIRLLEHVVNGQGQEKDKITSPYSSSLQSFLIFRKVSDKNPIYINEIPYTKVDFEVKNPVINYPSSIDVKLSNDNKDVLFIESKLYEVVRDSSKAGTAEIGASYFSNHKNGYFKKLNIAYSDLESIGIKFLPGETVYGKEDASKIKAKINNYNGNSKVDAIGDNKWVYSYGIKQILSHVIGILNYKGSPLEKRKFAYIYNTLPGFDEKDAIEKIENYNSHIETVCDKIKERNTKLKTVLQKPIITYQELYTEENVAYFESVGKNICNYYKLV